MEKFLDFRNTRVRYTVKGSGNVVVLLHGYLENIHVWDGFADQLSRHYRIICIDLMGHGNSGIAGETHSMDLMAGAVHRVLDHAVPGNYVLAGHSMGGYVTLAFAERYPESLKGFALVNSSPFADTEEKEKNRERAIRLVREGKKDQIVKGHAPMTFAPENREKYAETISVITNEAMLMPDRGITAALRGMMERPDRTEILKKSKIPVMVMAGLKDEFIPVEVSEKMFRMNPAIHKLLLKNSGHMGFIEEQSEALNGMLEFLSKVYG